MKGKKLDISVTELLAMREQGYSNKDICNILEISLPTVLRYIGKQPMRMESVTKHMDSKPRPHIDTHEPKNPEAPRVQIVSQIVTVGEYAFELNMINKTINISGTNGCQFVLVRQDDAEKFAEAVMAVQKFMEDQKG